MLDTTQPCVSGQPSARPYPLFSPGVMLIFKCHLSIYSFFANAKHFFFLKILPQTVNVGHVHVPASSTSSGVALYSTMFTSRARTMRRSSSWSWGGCTVPFRAVPCALTQAKHCAMHPALCHPLCHASHPVPYPMPCIPPRAMPHAVPPTLCHSLHCSRWVLKPWHPICYSLMCLLGEADGALGGWRRRQHQFLYSLQSHIQIKSLQACLELLKMPFRTCHLYCLPSAPLHLG